MQDEVNDKMVALVVRASKFTANTLYKATKAYVDHQIRVSVRAMLKEALEEARRQNAERKPTGKKKDISR